MATHLEEDLLADLAERHVVAGHIGSVVVAVLVAEVGEDHILRVSFVWVTPDARELGFGDTMRDRSEDDPRSEIVVSVETGAAEARRLADVLTRQGIRVLRTDEPVTVELRDLDEEIDGRREVTLPAGSYRIPLEQPAYALVRSLLDQHIAMGDAFIEEEEARVERGLHPRG